MSRTEITPTEITRADLMSMADYEAIRATKRHELVSVKRPRRLPVGPDATFYFECYETMWWQIHEMLYIERGGEAQIGDELTAYNPLIPKGRELVATLMFEIEDADRRARFLDGLGGVEETCFISLDGEEIAGNSEEDVDRTNAAGKASSVQFLHFPFTDAQVEKFRDPAIQVMLGIKHPKYAHMTIMSPDARAALGADFS
ncbi:MAG: DUF3501 family protein [Rhodospirillaceae bacterium]|jgi:hypothetical protein|nr:DUF3501 family protein [Rhodospirillaceae bacterium]